MILTFVIQNVVRKKVSNFIMEYLQIFSFMVQLHSVKFDLTYEKYFFLNGRPLLYYPSLFQYISGNTPAKLILSYSIFRILFAYTFSFTFSRTGKSLPPLNQATLRVYINLPELIFLKISIVALAACVAAISC